MSLRRSRAVLADDHPMMLEGLCKLLAPSLEVVATTTDGPSLLAAAERLQPDLVITEVTMPGFDGIEVTCRLETAVPGVKVLILSIHAEPSYVRAAFEAGVSGYLTKTSMPEEIERAVAQVLAGHFYVSPTVTRETLERLEHRLEHPLPASGEALTPRELDILRLMAVGLGNPQIARRLGVKVTTVRTHLSSLYEKLGLKSRVELALYAAQAGTAP